MKRLALVLTALACARAGEKPPSAIEVAELAAPAAPRAGGVAFAAAADGGHRLSWVEPAAGGANALRFATFDPAARRWSAAQTVATDTTITTNPIDVPQLVFAGHDQAFAIWTDGHGGARLCVSRDRGATWSRPEPWARAAHTVEKFSFAVLADGRVLAAWLDHRGPEGDGRQKLCARVLDAGGLSAEAAAKAESDTLVDDAVCDCCPTTLIAFPDGTALVAYRGRTDDEIRDIRVARFRGDHWEAPHTVNNDGWRINACPVNGPRLASDGGRVAIAWFTAADNEPRVLASFSPDAGARFLMPLALDLGKAAGHVDAVLLHDGAFLVSWLEADGSLWLRRITPEFSATDPIALSAARDGKVNGIARLALVRDYAGGDAPAQMLAAFARGGPQAGVHTFLVTVPEGALLNAERNCDCAPTADELRGYSIRGAIVATLPANSSVRVEHAELPGVFAAGTREFNVAPDLLAALPAGRRFLGRVERRDGAWWLFDVRLIAEATAR